MTEITEAQADALATCKKIWEHGILKRFETEGFIRGSKKGKTMEVPLANLVESLEKQVMDFQQAYYAYLINQDQENVDDFKQKIADIRNLAGCVFLKLSSGNEGE